MTEKGPPKLGGVPSTEQQKNSQTPDAKAQRSVSDADDVVTNSIQKEEVPERVGSTLPTDLVEVNVSEKEKDDTELVKDVSNVSQRLKVPEQHDKIAESLTSHGVLEERLEAKKTEEDDSSRSRGRHSPDENVGTLVPSQIVVTSISDQGASKVLGTERNGRLRRGKWTAEEEAYVARVIQDFNSGYLDAPAGTTLRTYLSEKLQCDPMRITKKFTGDACIGKRVFHPAVRSPNNASSIDKAQVGIVDFFALYRRCTEPILFVPQAELVNLEKRWHRRLESQQRESAKKVAVTAAACVAEGQPEVSHLCSKKTTVVQTAAWLDRARSLLEDPSSDAPSNDDVSKSLESQMKEVQRLIHEGPGIQENTAGFGTLTDQSDDQATASSGSDTEPADKRLRTAEDAEALVGFIRTVQAFAASGQES